MQVRPTSPQAILFRSQEAMRPVPAVAHQVPEKGTELPRFGQFARPLLGLPKFGAKVERPINLNNIEANGNGTDELRRLNEARIQLTAAAREAGLDPFDLNVFMMPEDTFLQLAARNGYKDRYPHWSWGQEYYRLKMPIVLHGIREIRELVINNDPSYAFLNDANPEYAQRVLLIHALARSDFYKNNLHFKYTNRRSEELFAANADRFKQLQEEHGMEAVESFIDKAHSLRNLVDSSRPLARQPRESAPSNDNPERDVLAYVINNATTLKDWQRDIMEMIRQETYSEVPVRKTTVMADGWAAFWNEKLNLQTPQFWDLQNTTREAQWTAKLFKANPVQVNSYKLGYTVFRMLEADFQRKYEGDPDADKKVLRELLKIRREEQDTSFLNKYLNKDMVEELLLYTFDPKKRNPDGSPAGHGMGYNPPGRGDNLQAQGTKLFINSREFEEIKEKLIANYVNAGQPVIEVVDGNFKDTGELYLRHIYDTEDLKKDYAEKTLTRLAQLWGKRVHLETIETDNEGKQSAVLLSSDGKSIFRKNL